MKAAAKARAEAGPPRDLGYRMPAEWEPHEATWLSWPHDAATFPRLARVEDAYVRIISAISPGEEVRLLVRDEAMRRRVAGRLEKAKVDPGRVRFLQGPYADVWFRDYGPAFVVDRSSRRKAMVHWLFNAWGRKYPELMADAEIPLRIQRERPMPRFVPGIVLEGGSIDVNGAGTVLTTEQCLLNKNRNPRLSRAQIEQALEDYLGAGHAVWLKEGVAGDDTDGHIDDIARFVAPDAVLCALEDDATDTNYAALRENFELLQESKDQDGRPLKVIPLPMPDPVGDAGGRLPASYANFYIGNAAVLVPAFGCDGDEKALQIVSAAFPGRKAVGIRCEDLVHGLGTLHCISQQEPAP